MDLGGRAGGSATLWWKRAITAGTVAALLVAGLAGCSSDSDSIDGSASSDGDGVRRELTLVSYSVAEAAYEEIIPAFQEYWYDQTGEIVEFTESYGGSGTQARAVADGLEADIVHLAMEPDVNAIVDAGLIEPGWQDDAPNRGVPTTSMIVFGVRPGNPLGIADWEDIAAPGVEVLTPDPKTSGGACWNILGAWGSVSETGGTEREAYDLVKRILANTVVFDKSARDCSNTFLQRGIGDVALLWESDAIIAKSHGEDFEIVYPTDTIQPETSVAVVDRVVDAKGNREVAEAFVEFLFTDEAQRMFADNGMRPISESILSEYRDVYGSPSGSVFSIAELGGWASVSPKFFGQGALYDQLSAAIAADRSGD